MIPTPTPRHPPYHHLANRADRTHTGADDMIAQIPHLHGIVPPVPTPLLPDNTVDTATLKQLITFQLNAGVHGLWILGTTARFDLLPDPLWRIIGETAIETAAGRVPMVANISDLGTERTLKRAAMFDDLPYDYYAVLPPWYQVMTAAEVTDYFHRLADEAKKPIVIYNAPWINNQLSFAHLRKLAEHPRIVGCKDVTPEQGRATDWSEAERRKVNFSYLHGNDHLATSIELGSDGFVSSLTNVFPEIAVAGDKERAFALQSQFLRLARIAEFGTYLGCLEAAFRHRGLLRKMLPPPLRSIDAENAAKVAELVERVGALPA